MVQKTKKNYTIYLLECLFKLPPGYFEGSIIRNSVTLTKKIVNDKGFEVDVLLETLKGELFVLEMQENYNKNAEFKNSMYVTKIYSNQLKSGELYNEVKPVTLINFVKKLSMSLHNTGDIINKYGIFNYKYHYDSMLPEYLTFYIVDIASDKEVLYNDDNKFEVMRRLLGSDTYEEAKEIVEESNNPLLKKLFKEMVEFMSNEYVQDYSEQERLIKSNLFDAKVEAHAEGLSEGLFEGEHNKQLEIAKKMLKANKPLEEIQLFTDLSLKELENLKNELN